MGKRVLMKFQDNAWVDGSVGLQWIEFIWRQRIFEPRLLILDVHKARKTSAVLWAIGLRHTTLAFMHRTCSTIGCSSQEGPVWSLQLLSLFP